MLLTSSVAEYPADAETPKTLLGAWLIDPSTRSRPGCIVNRLWHYQFGIGLVETLNDFGVNGDSPSHPELSTSWRTSWSPATGALKRMQRLIVTSSTYRQASSIRGAAADRPRQPPALALRSPPAHGRGGPRRHARRLGPAEAKVAARASCCRSNRSWSICSTSPRSGRSRADKREHDRRSVYLVAKRNLRLPFMEVFDPPDLQTSCARRESSTHAPQALEMLNGELSQRPGRGVRPSDQAEAGDDPRTAVERAFRLAAGRGPHGPESAHLALRIPPRQPLEEFALAMFNLNAFLYVE